MANATSLIMLSGGLDSVTLAHHLVQQQATDLRAIYIDIGYLPRRAERNSAKMAAHQLGIPLEVVDLSGIVDMVSGFVPTEDLGRGELDKGQPSSGAIASPPNYVVGFHVMLSVASYHALLAEIMEVTVALVKEQFDHNPNLSTFAAQWPLAIANLNPNRSQSLITPFGRMTKAEVVKMGVQLNIDYRNTWSCHLGGALHCGKCGGCVARQQAFATANTPDPTAYES